MPLPDSHPIQIKRRNDASIIANGFAGDGLVSQALGDSEAAIALRELIFARGGVKPAAYAACDGRDEQGQLTPAAQSYRALFVKLELISGTIAASLDIGGMVATG